MASHQMESNYGDGGAGSTFYPVTIWIALVSTVIGCCISFLSVWLHWKNYRKPNQQRQVIRILWMVPIYGISTYISLVSLDAAFYVDTFRDIYEAFVIYAFFNLLLNKLGGERALIIMLHSRPPTQNFFPGTLYSRDIFVGDPYTFLFVKRGILQFVYVKPVLAVITMLLKATGNYNEGEFTLTSSYFYLTFIYNISVCLSLWCLMVFFYATKQDLAEFRPLPKFLCVKAIIFFSFWQGVAIALLVFAGIIPESEHISVAIQDFLVCLEMVPFAIGHAYSFSYTDYFDRIVHSARMPIRKAISDSFGIKDVLMDTLDTLQGDRFSYRSFEPSEGVPHIGSSRTSRIMAGLRYSNMTAKKHWLGPAPTSRFLNSSGRGMNEEVYIDDDHEPLEFEDPQSDDEMEKLYQASRKMMFGDYNYPVIDFREPILSQTHRHSQYGGLDQSMPFNQSKMDIGPREGCIDVIIQVERGKYVVNDDMHRKQSPPPTPPQPPLRNPTLTDVKRIREDIAKHRQSLASPRPSPSHSTPQQVTSRYPQPQSSVSSSLHTSSRFDHRPDMPQRSSSAQPPSTVIQPPSEDPPSWHWPQHESDRETPFSESDYIKNPWAK